MPGVPNKKKTLATSNCGYKATLDTNRLSIVYCSTQDQDSLCIQNNKVNGMVTGDEY